jgi:hypothetical protein
LSATERPPIPSALVAAGVTLALDALAVDIVRALEARGLRALLVKGSSSRLWLYPRETSRRSCDVDLLVDPRSFGEAEEVVAGLGFAPRVHWRDDRTARHWARAGSPLELDLHRSLVGVGAPPQAAWEVLAAHAEELRLPAGPVPALGEAARCLVLALHAAKHRRSATQPVADLELALARAPEQVWRRAAALAGELDAVPAFAAGLRLTAAGTLLAARLELSHRLTPELALLEAQAPGAAALNRLVSIHGLRARARFALRRAFPDASTMRAMDTGAQRGNAGLAWSYARRAGWLAAHAHAAIAAVRSARRRTRGGPCS